jgi:hypothetical protein
MILTPAYIVIILYVLGILISTIILGCIASVEEPIFNEYNDTTCLLPLVLA